MLIIIIDDKNFVRNSHMFVVKKLLLKECNLEYVTLLKKKEKS